MRLAEFLKNAGTRQYRDLVEHHVRRQTAHQLMVATTGETVLLPASMQPHVMSFIDVLNERLMVSADFWRHATCIEAMDTIIDIANSHFELDIVLPINPEQISGAEQDLVLGLFQIATLSFAYTAVDQRPARKFMGIRKGLIFR